MGIGFFWASSGNQASDVQHVTAPAPVSDLRVTVTASETGEPTNLVDLQSELSWTLETVSVDFNDTVTKGAVLAELNTTKLEALLAVSRAALDGAIARVAMAQATWCQTRERYEGSRQFEEHGVAAEQAFNAARAAVGNMATFTVDAYYNRLFSAEVSEIRFALLTVDCGVTCKPTLSATADNVVAEISDALTVPNAALDAMPPRQRRWPMSGLQTARITIRQSCLVASNSGSLSSALWRAIHK